MTKNTPESSDEAEHQLKAAVQAAERLGRLNHRRLDAVDALADFYFRRGQFRESEPLQNQVLALKEKIYGPEHLTLALPLTEISRSYEAMGRLGEAEAVATLALKIHERDPVQNSVAIARDLGDLARLAAWRNRVDESVAHLVRAQKIARIVFGERHGELGRFHMAWGHVESLLGRTGPAWEHFETAVQILSEVHGPRHPEVADAWLRLGDLERAARRFPSAFAFYQRALAVHERGEGEWGMSVGRTYFHMGVASLAKGDFRRAEETLQRSRDIRETALGPIHSDVAESYAAWGDALAKRRKFEAAERAYHRAWEIHERCCGPDAPGLLRLLSGLAELYYERAVYDEADRLLNHLLRATERVYGPGHPAARAARENAATSLDAQDRFEEAAALRDLSEASKTIKTLPKGANP